MNVFIVYAHPEPKSMNGLLKNKAIELFQSKGHQIMVSDLYDMDFIATIKPSEFPFYQDDFFDLQQFQSQSQELNKVPIYIKEEHAKLKWADLVVFQFPLWWYSVPAIMKGYFDNVFSVGFAYAGNFELEDKKYLLSFTTGAPKSAWTEDKKGTIDELLFHLDNGIFNMLRMVRLKPFIGYGSKRLNEMERENLLLEYGVYLSTILTE